MDNCGAFNKLIPLLPKEYGYLAFDLPGHGRSSRYPEGMNYSYYDYVILIERIRREYQWEKVSIIAHSMSTSLCFYYMVMFPDNIDLCVALDNLEPIFYPPAVHMKIWIDRWSKDLQEQKSFSWSELVDVVVRGSKGSIDREFAKEILIRNIDQCQKNPGKFVFSFDNKNLKGYNMISYSNQEVMNFAEHIRTPVMLLLGKDSYMRNYNPKGLGRIREYMLDNIPDFHIRYGPGNHHFLLTHPEAYADDISWFIRKYRPVKANL